MGKRTVIGSCAPEILSEIAAESGYYFLEMADTPDNKTEINLIPILAWAVEAETFFPYPITVHGIKYADLTYLHKSGIVMRPLEQLQFNSLDTWLRHMNLVDVVTNNGVMK